MTTPRGGDGTAGSALPVTDIDFSKFVVRIRSWRGVSWAKIMQESDGILLSRFASDRDEAAFNALTGRHLGLIYHTALRRTGNRQLAEEVSQNVLSAMAKKASGLARHPSRLPAWLHRATVFESSKAMRAEASHHRRKQLRHPDDIAATGGEATWTGALPHLDPALDRLSESDRQVVLQHYFEGKPFSRIGEQQGRPAATVQKQCRRALDKLARMLRGKGVAITAGALASGLGSQLAKAAPPVFAKLAATKALAGSATYSTTQLTLFMATKSKAVLPAALAVLLVPLGFQQLAISRASARNAALRHSLAGSRTELRPQPSRPKTGKVGTSGRLSIDQLHRAMTASHRGGLRKDIQFFEMIGSLDADDLARLIPQAMKLTAPQQERRSLLRHLVGSLAEIDPERALRATPSTDGGPMLNVGAEYALYRWSAEDPDRAIDWLAELARRDPGPSWQAAFQLQAAVLCSLIENGSPRVREVVELVPDEHPGQRIREAMDRPTSPSGSNRFDPDPDAAVDRIGKFLPWIREYARDESSSCGPDDILRRLLFEISGTKAFEAVPEMLLDGTDLLPAERRTVAGFQAERLIEDGYTSYDATSPREAEETARQWLDTHDPEGAGETFERAKSRVVAHQRMERDHRLTTFERSERVRDADLARDLMRKGFSEFPDLRKRAVEQARRIKDPAKRREVVGFLESQRNPQPANP